MCNTTPFRLSPTPAFAPRELSALAVPGRLTRNQALVLEVLRAATGRALTAYEVLASLEPSGIKGPQSVYRALQSLLQAGMVHRIESLNAFTLCVHDHGPAKCPHGEAAPPHRPAFIVCRGCRALEEITDPGLLSFGGDVARRGFRVEERVLELVGVCTACDSAAPEQQAS